jgi:prolipoprotein diacylglyceryltransferase
MLPEIVLPGLGWTLRSYTAMLALAVALSLWIGPRWAQMLEGIDPQTTRRVFLALAAAAFAGGRLHVVGNYWRHYAAHPAAIAEFWAGLHAGGAIVAIVLTLPLVVRGTGVPAAKFADALVPTFGLGIAVARTGCYLHGCCFGTPCALPWCVSFPPGSDSYALQVSTGLLAPDAAHAAPVHPLELYFATTGVLLTIVGLWLYRRKAYDGEVALVTILLFSASSAWLETFRGAIPQRVWWGPLPELEWVALAMTVLSFAALSAAELIHRRRPWAERMAA